jgi:hypothetical protein
VAVCEGGDISSGNITREHCSIVSISVNTIVDFNDRMASLEYRGHCLYYTPFEEGRAYCFVAVCRSLGLSVCRSSQFPFIFFALDAHNIEMKFGV